MEFEDSLYPSEFYSNLEAGFCNEWYIFLCSLDFESASEYVWIFVLIILLHRWIVWILLLLSCQVRENIHYEPRGGIRGVPNSLQRWSRYLLVYVSFQFSFVKISSLNPPELFMRHVLGHRPSLKIFSIPVHDTACNFVFLIVWCLIIVSGCKTVGNLQLATAIRN